MPRFFVMRHAKSDWSRAASDYERPLNDRGIRAAEKMGLWLASHDILPELVVTSPARRALETTRIVCKQLGKGAADIQLDERIYEASLDDLLVVVSEYGRKGKNLLLTGHNPGLDQLVEFLASEKPERSRTGKLMTTATIAIMDFAGDDISADVGRGLLVQVARPKET